MSAGTAHDMAQVRPSRSRASRRRSKPNGNWSVSPTDSPTKVSTSGSPNCSSHRQTSLQAVYDMFPAVDRAVILHVYQSSHHNVQSTLEYFLEHAVQPCVLSASVVPCPVPSLPRPPLVDRISQLPQDTLFHLCEFISVYDLARFGCVNRVCSAVVREKSRSLRSLDLNPYRTLDDAKLLWIFGQYPNVESVSMKNCRDFHSFGQLGFCALGVTSLNLLNCDALSDRDLAHVFEVMPHLKQLDLSNTSVGDGHVDAFLDAKAAPALSSLLLNGCPSITGMVMRLNEFIALLR